MTVYRKCRPCKHRDNCEIKQRLAMAIKGFGVRTISHRCQSFEPALTPGKNIWVAVQAYPHNHEDAYYGGTPPVATFPGHFVRYSKTFGRAIVYIKPGTPSECDEYTFEPANGKSGFCKVSYAPYHNSPGWGLRKGIVGLREGETSLQTCCGLPVGGSCADCSQIKEFAA